MVQVSQNQLNLQNFELINDFDQINKITDEVSHQLEQFVNPKVTRLGIIPDVVTVPALKKLLVSRRHNFKDYNKYYCSEYNYFVFFNKKNNSALVLHQNLTEVYFTTKSGKIYCYTLTGEEENILLPSHISFYNIDDAEFIHPVSGLTIDEPIITLFGLQYIMTGKIYKVNGSEIYIIPTKTENIEKWLIKKEKIPQLGINAYKLTEHLYYYNTINTSSSNQKLSYINNEYFIYIP